MGMQVKHEDSMRSISDRILVRVNDKIRSVAVIKVFHGGVLRTVWEAITSFIFSSDGYGLHTKDGYVLKFKDEE